MAAGGMSTSCTTLPLASSQQVAQTVNKRNNATRVNTTLQEQQLNALTVYSTNYWWMLIRSSPAGYSNITHNATLT